ncbi:MAG: PDZ domain-containing protein [Acetobacteraceae bacterium]|nr:PDZ domain-containing protein [Acetobacteraceae bacterium]
MTEAAAPLLAAVRTGPNRHAPAIRWRADLLVTCDQALPALDSFTLVLPGGGLTEAPPVRRDANLGVAALRLTAPQVPANQPFVAPASGPPPVTGHLVIVVGVAFDATPTVRLAAIHRVGATQSNPGGTSILLDLPGDRFAAGSAVIDASGSFLGMASLDRMGAAVVIPYEALARFVEPPRPIEHPPAGMSSNGAASVAMVSARRGWLGVALQPTTLPDMLRQLAGQPSGRMVVSITPRGPADQAGLRLGDVLLALDGQSVSGSHALRAVVSTERIGRRLEVRLLRDGAIHTMPLVVAAQPEA